MEHVRLPNVNTNPVYMLGFTRTVKSSLHSVKKRKDG